MKPILMLLLPQIKMDNLFTSFAFNKEGFFIWKLRFVLKVLSVLAPKRLNSQEAGGRGFVIKQCLSVVCENWV